MNELETVAQKAYDLMEADWDCVVIKNRTDAIEAACKELDVNLCDDQWDEVEEKYLDIDYYSR